MAGLALMVNWVYPNQAVEENLPYKMAAVLIPNQLLACVRL